MRWTGNGLADGVAITTSNVNTAGNGDTVTYQVSGTPTIVTAGDGVNISGGTAVISRLDASVTAQKAVTAKLFYTANVNPTSALERVLAIRSASAGSAAVLHGIDGVFSFENAAGAEVVASRSPAVATGDKLQIDLTVALSASATTANGRIFFRVRNITTPSWNGGSDWFYDTKYTANAGTVNPSVFRAGKQATGSLASANRFEQYGWALVTVNPADLSQAAASAYFMASPYAVKSGAATAAFTVAATAAGKNVPRGAATSGFTLGVTAAGVAPVVGAKTGSASAAFSIAVAAAGKEAPKGAATVGLSTAVAVTGKRPPKGAASAAFTEAVTATGKRTLKGLGAASFTEAVSATGKRAPKGSVTVGLNLAVTATGTAPAVGTKTGVATVALSVAIAVAGKRVPKATTTAALTLSAAPAGKRVPKGTVQPAVLLALLAAGKRTPKSATIAGVSLAIGAIGERPSLLRLTAFEIISTSHSPSVAAVDRDFAVASVGNGYSVTAKGADLTFVPGREGLL